MTEKRVVAAAPESNRGKMCGCCRLAVTRISWRTVRAEHCGPRGAKHVHGNAASSWPTRRRSSTNGQRSSGRNSVAGRRVASSLSEDAERRSDLAAAVQWARRAAAISPDDEVTVARLIELLDRSGDRVGALTTYETLRQRLLVEFRATPSPETQALVAPSTRPERR